MNIFNKFLMILAGCLAGTNLICWDGKLLEIKNRNGEKAIGVMVRYYSARDASNIEELLYQEGFKGSCCARTKMENGKFYILGPSNCITPRPSEKLYEEYLEHFRNNKNQVQLCHEEISCDKIVMIIVDNRPANTALSLANAKKAMQRLAKEDPSYVFTETDFVNGKPNTSVWSKLKNFMCNQKFLYAMSALSALYLGYEYLKQQ